MKRLGAFGINLDGSMQREYVDIVDKIFMAW
jgi:hypothetical protein